MNVFRENWRIVHERASQDSLEALRRADTETAALTVASSDYGRVFAWQTDAENSVLLHSRRAPMDEARRQVANWEKSNKPDWHGMIVVLGAAGAFHIQAIAEKMGSDGLLLIMDRTPASFKRMMETVSLSFIENTPATVIFSVHENLEDLRWEFVKRLQSRNFLRFTLFHHPGTWRVAEESYQELVDCMITAFRVENMGCKTNAVKGDHWLANAIANLPVFKAGRPINSLKNAFQDIPAVMIAAGPSLDDTRHLLQQIKGHALIIAVGTALKSILATGIKPDFVVTLDASELTWKQFQGVDPSEMYLFSAQIAYPPIPTLFKDRLFPFSSNAVPGFNKWLSHENLCPDSLNVAGTVSISAIDAAIYMGCAPIYFLGLDLCFRQDGTTHASKTAKDGEQRDVSQLWKVPGNFQEEVLTSRNFAVYIDMLRTYIEKKRRYGVTTEFYNVTSGGAWLKHAPVISPEEMVYELPDESRNFTQEIDKLYSKTTAVNSQDFTSTVERVNSDLKKLAEEMLQGIDICNELKTLSHDNSEKQNNLLKQLDDIDASLREQRDSMCLVDDALRAATLAYLTNPLAREEDPSASRTDQFEAILDQNIEMYTKIKEAAEWIKQYLEDAVNNFVEAT